MQLAQMEKIAHRLGPASDKALDPDFLADLHELRRHQYGGRTTKQWMKDIEYSGVPTNVPGGLYGLETNPVTVNQATVTGSATEQAIIPSSLFPVRQNVQSGQVYRMFSSGTSTTAATPGTYTMAGRIGPSPTNASPLFGAVSGSLTPVASATAAQWRLFGIIVIRGSGTANTAVGTWEMNHSGTIGGGGPVSATGNAIFGGISASFDSTGTAVQVWLGVTHATSTTNTWVPQMVVWGSLN